MKHSIIKSNPGAANPTERILLTDSPVTLDIVINGTKKSYTVPLEALKEAIENYSEPISKIVIDCSALDGLSISNDKNSDTLIKDVVCRSLELIGSKAVAKDDSKSISRQDGETMHPIS